MNAHHEWWNSSIHAPKRAETLVSVMERGGFQLVNIPDEPTYNFKNGKGQSVIDLTFASPSIFDNIVNWVTDEDQATGSDHELIRYTILSDQSEAVPDPRSGRYNWKAADWDKFSKHLQATEASLLLLWKEQNGRTEDDLEAPALDLRNAIIEAVDVSVPLLRMSPRAKRWWTKEVKEMRKEIARKLRRWKTLLSPEFFSTFRLARNKYFHKIREAK